MDKNIKMSHYNDAYIHERVKQHSGWVEKKRCSKKKKKKLKMK